MASLFRPDMRQSLRITGAPWLVVCLIALFGTSRTKGAANAGIAPPGFSKPAGVYTNEFLLELQANGATIRYTLDGSEPQATSTVYTAALRVTNCIIVRARAWNTRGETSSVTSESYVLLASDLLGFSSNLPLLVVRSGSDEIVSYQKSLGNIKVIEGRSPSSRVSLTDRASFDGVALLNIRGHSSLRYPKHSYNLKLVDELQDSRKASLLELPKHSDWALYGPYPDKTLIRDVLAYELSNEMGRWAPKTRFVEVFVSEGPNKLSMEDYAGVYVLEEKVTRDKSGVNIAKLDPAATEEPEVSGGYVFKKDHASSYERKRFDPDGPPQAGTSTNRTGYPTPPGGFPADPAGFFPAYAGKTTSNRVTRPVPAASARPKRPKSDANRARTNHVAAAAPGSVKLDEQLLFHEDEGFRTQVQRNQFYYCDPEPEEITAVQRAWLKDYLNRFESALYGPSFRDKASGYRGFIDPGSFIDHHLLVEVTKNVDGFRFSTFYYKDRNGLLQMGPAWDWNLSFGNADGKQGYMPDHWLWPQLDDQQYSWFRRLFEDPDFAQQYVDRWSELRANVFATSNFLAKIDRLLESLNEAQQRNFAKWEILGRDINPNYFVGNSYQEEVDWMKGWITNRLSWIDAQFLAAPRMVASGSGKVELQSFTPNGKTYFTIDGSDPRLSGGSSSSSAKVYDAPISPGGRMTIRARVQSGSRWSPLASFSWP
jgi:hypothetical protein